MDYTMKSFLKHMAVVFESIPYLDNPVSNKVYNAYRLAKKEHKKIMTKCTK